MRYCIGAIDGKHVAIEAPFKSGALFQNHKRFFSIVLMAIWDPNSLHKIWGFPIRISSVNSLVTFTGEIVNRELHFLCSDYCFSYVVLGN